MAMSAEHRSKLAAVHRQWWRLHMSEKFSSGMKNPKQTNKQNQTGHKASLGEGDIRFYKYGPFYFQKWDSALVFFLLINLIIYYLSLFILIDF